MKERINLKSSAARSELRVLILGYSGANNTGAETLLLADIEDVRAVLGPQAVITIPSLNPPNLRRYVKETPNLRIAHMPTIYFSTIRRLVRENDLLMLVEGSTYMDTWSSALLWIYLWATRCVDDMGKPSLAYAVDAGQIKSAFNRRLLRREASKTSLIINRAAAAAERLRSLGVTAPMEVTADNAFNFRTDLADAGLLSRAQAAHSYSIHHGRLSLAGSLPFEMAKGSSGSSKPEHSPHVAHN
jgi:polysaccharide pyruvyl transferase WcaK-like protein